MIDPSMRPLSAPPSPGRSHGTPEGMPGIPQAPADASGSPSDAYTAADPHWELAGRLMEAHRVPSARHVLLQENVATCLAQMMPAPDAARLLERSSSATADSLRQELATSRWSSERWMTKVDRDLRAPYTDEQVLQHLESLDRELDTRLQRVLAASSTPFPHRLYVTGSLARGRFGANSDADILVEASGEAQHQAVSREFLAQQDDGVTLSPLPPGGEGFREFMLMMTGPRIEVEGSRMARTGGHVLQDAHAHVLEQKGLRLTEVDGGVEVQRVAPHEKRSPEVPSPIARFVVGRVWTEQLDPGQKLELMEHPRGLKGHAIRLAGTLLGGAALIPGPVGGAVRGIMDHFIRQTVE